MLQPIKLEYPGGAPLQAKNFGPAAGPKNGLRGARPMRIMAGFALLVFCCLTLFFNKLHENVMRDSLEAGINFFNGGRYFEAHEIFEDMWRSAGGPLRLFYQGLVQAAVGLHHLHKGNLNGAAAQLEKSLSKLEQYPERFCRIDNGKLTADLRRVLEALTPQAVHIDMV